MRALRRPRTLAPRRLQRPAAPDATLEPGPGPEPEAVFDRVTGPYGDRRHGVAAPGFAAYDEET